MPEDSGISVASVYAFVKFSPAPIICWIVQKTREMVDMILNKVLLGFFWKKSEDLRKFARFLKC